MLEFRLHPVAGYRRPPGCRTTTCGRRSSTQLTQGVDPQALRLGDEVRPLAGLWDGLEAFPAYGDEIEPARLARARRPPRSRSRPTAPASSTTKPIGDAWERANGKVSIVALLLEQLTADGRGQLALLAAPGAGRAAGRTTSSTAFAVDRAEREVEPAVRAGERLRQRVARRRSRPHSSRADGPSARRRSCGSGTRASTSGRARSRGAGRRAPRSATTGSHSMPVSSSTSFIAISDGE